MVLDIEPGETTDQSVPGTEDFTVVEWRWSDDGEIEVVITAGGETFVETYTHSETKRVANDE